MVWALLGLILLLVLKLLFYKPMFGDRHARQDANPWQQYWGESYGPELKQQLLKPLFGKLETEEKIGNLIIDVGSGASPVTRLVKTKQARPLLPRCTRECPYRRQGRLLGAPPPPSLAPPEQP